jgi:hypothetical protein
LLALPYLSMALSTCQYLPVTLSCLPVTLPTLLVRLNVVHTLTTVNRRGYKSYYDFLHDWYFRTWGTKFHTMQGLCCMLVCDLTFNGYAYHILRYRFSMEKDNSSLEMVNHRRVSQHLNWLRRLSGFRNILRPIK